MTNKCGRTCEKTKKRKDDLICDELCQVTKAMCIIAPKVCCCESRTLIIDSESVCEYRYFRKIK